MFFSEYAKIHIYAGCPVFLPFPAVFRVPVVCVLLSRGLLTVIRTRIHTRTHVRVRGFLDSNF